MAVAERHAPRVGAAAAEVYILLNDRLSIFQISLISIFLISRLVSM